jgi:ATP-dependent DNA ligase
MMALWRSTLVRDRRAPAGFIRPAQPVLSDTIPMGPEWSHELKWDGWRMVARRDGDRVCLWSRSGRNWTNMFPAIVSAMKRLPVESVVLDGETVCLLEDGRPDFGALRSRQACREARLVAFDLLGPTARTCVGCHSVTVGIFWRGSSRPGSQRCGF